MVEDCKRGCFVSIKIILVESNEIDGTDDMDYVQMCVLNSFPLFILQLAVCSVGN